MKEFIPYLDFKKLNLPYQTDFYKRLDKIFKSGIVLFGPNTLELEKKLSSIHNNYYSLGVSNGLDAIRLILLAFIEQGKLKKGDKVIIPSNTYIASILPVIEFGLVPVLIEPDINTLNLDWKKVNKKIINKCKAIIIVHLYGRICYSDKISELKKSGLIIIEDNAQSICSKFRINKNKEVISGTLGDAAAFSFYPGKNTGALGDAGAVVTKHRDLYQIISALRNYGSEKKYFNKYKGLNCRIDEFNSAFTLLKINNLNSIIKKRRKIAKKYLNFLENENIILPFIDFDFDNDNNHVWHIFPLIIKNNKRDEFQSYLENNMIKTVIHYPIPLYKQHALKNDVKIDSSKLTDYIHDSIISIPLNETLSNNQVNTIIKIINSWNPYL